MMVASYECIKVHFTQFFPNLTLYKKKQLSSNFDDN
jgi:hypothetical protein